MTTIETSPSEFDIDSKEKPLTPDQQFEDASDAFIAYIAGANKMHLSERPIAEETASGLVPVSSRETKTKYVDPNGTKAQLILGEIDSQGRTIISVEKGNEGYSATLAQYPKTTDQEPSMLRYRTSNSDHGRFSKNAPEATIEQRLVISTMARQMLTSALDMFIEQ